MADGTSGIDSKSIIDPLIETMAEKARLLGLKSEETLDQLGIGLLQAHDGEDRQNVALRTVQELLRPAYGLLIKEIGGIEAEHPDRIDEKRKSHPQTFIDATLTLMHSYAEGNTDTTPANVKIPPISLSGALSVSCLLEPDNHSRKTVDWATKTVSIDPNAAILLPKLRALSQAAPAK